MLEYHLVPRVWPRWKKDEKKEGNERIMDGRKEVVEWIKKKKEEEKRT